MRYICAHLCCIVLFVGCAEDGVGQTPQMDASVQKTMIDNAPSLHVSYTGPEAFTAHAKQSVTLFCFTLEAVGADLEVTLPVMEIIAIDGGFVQTNNPDDARVFRNPAFTKNGVIIAGNQKTPINTEMTVASMDFASAEPLLVMEGEVDEYCLQATIVSWSLTPSDYSGHVYHVVMSGWSEGVVQIVSTGALLEQNQIFPSVETIGNPITVKATDDDPLYYTGDITVAVAADSPNNTSVEAGTPFVPVLHLLFSATGNGGCIRGIDFQRHGLAKDSDFRSVQLWYDTTLKAPLYAGVFKDGLVTIGWHDTGVLFCVEAGTQLSLTLGVHVEAGASIGDTFSLRVENAENFDRPNGLTVDGDYPLEGGTMQIVAPQ